MLDSAIGSRAPLRPASAASLQAILGCAVARVNREIAGA